MKKAEEKNKISLCSTGEKLLLAQLGNCRHGRQIKRIKGVKKKVCTQHFRQK